MRSRTKILVVDDQPVLRRGISSSPARHSHLLIVGEAADGCEAMAKARALLPNIVLLDTDLPGMIGLAAAEALRKESPPDSQSLQRKEKGCTPRRSAHGRG